jgi:hypothetical protein
LSSPQRFFFGWSDDKTAVLIKDDDTDGCSDFLMALGFLASRLPRFCALLMLINVSTAHRFVSAWHDCLYRRATRDALKTRHLLFCSQSIRQWFKSTEGRLSWRSLQALK